MNMRTPPDLIEKDPIYSNVPQLEGNMEVTNQEWTPEELENAEIQVQQELLEEEFIAECFEQMMAEEEAEWCYYTNNLQSPYYSTHTISTTSTTDSLYHYNTEQTTTEQRFFLTSKLNPEAPEFIPRGIA
ncbi:translation repressor [Mactra antiquata]